MGIIVLSIFFFGSGMLFLFWPEELRDWTLKSYARAGLARPVFLQKLMFTRGYILAFRIGGAFAVIISCLILFWYYVQH